MQDMVDISTIEGLKEMARQCDETEAEFLRLLHEDSRIADNMRDYWKNQSCGEES